MKPCRLLLVCAVLLSSLGLHAASITFNFTLDEPGYVSAAAYKTDGTLVKTIWRRQVFYAAGNYSGVWDGTDDSGAAVSAGTYQIKTLLSNMRYIWDGVIQNNSADMTGRTVHKGFYTINSMAVGGTKVFYNTGYNEGDYGFHAFEQADPQRTVLNFSWRIDQGQLRNCSGNIWDLTWCFSASDGTWIYFACAANVSSPGFVVANNVSDGTQAYFTNGQQMAQGGGTTWPNVIPVGVQPSITGLAVQSTGTLLAVSVASENKVYLLDKRVGNVVRTFTVTAPRGLAMDPNGDLWVLTGTSAVRYTNLGTTPSVATTIVGFSNPLAVAVHPSNANIVMVADGGSNQKVFAYNSTGGALWNLGQTGGYQANGPAVQSDKFWFHTRNIGDATYLAIQPDGAFWVGDPGNYRAVKFNASRVFQDQIMFPEHSYVSTVDSGNNTRVFGEFQEFVVDYSKSIAPNNGSWTLVRNWAANLPAQYFGFRQGLKTVRTLSNGRTYGIISDFSTNPEQRTIVELPASGFFRFTGIMLDKDTTSLEADGALRWAITSGGTVTFYERTLSGFDGSGNPVWNAQTVKATAPAGTSDPTPVLIIIGPIGFPITSSGVLVSFNSTLENRFHLGGVLPGGNSWLWRGAPAVLTDVPPDGLGSYDIGDSVTYGGNLVMANGRNIVYGYHGEFYQNSGQANQLMHFYDNGLVAGQFGEPSNRHPVTEGAIAGFSGNNFSPSLTTANGELYLWCNDEWGHGVHRWHLQGANILREQSASGTLGSTITLSAAAPNFPTNLRATGGNGAVQLNWNAVAGASSYNVKYSTTDGGPYTNLGSVTVNASTVPSLVNDALYYFIVTAVTAGVESANSAQVAMRPFDPGVVVHSLGRVDEWRPSTILPIDSTAPAAGRPALNLKYAKSPFLKNSIGTKGYVVWNYTGAGGDRYNLQSPFTVTEGSGWFDDQWLHQWFSIDGVEGSRFGLFANPVGTININVSDSNFHYVTVFCPVRFDDPRTYTVKLTPQGASTPVASQSVNSPAGFSSNFQFLFKGNVTLTIDASTGFGSGMVNAIFLDDAASLPNVPAAPTGFNAYAGNGQVSLAWNSSVGATSYNVKRSTTSGGPYSTIAPNVTATSYNDTTVSSCSTYYYVVSAVSAGGESPNSLQASATPFGNLPSPWLHQDIGSVGFAGNAGACGSTFTVLGSGTDIWDNADSFHFTYQTLTGDGSIVARVVTIGATDPWAKAGVMLRESLTAGSRHAMMILSSSQGSSFQWRDTSNGSMQFLNQTGVTAPYWVKLTRAGNTFTGFSSPNGTTWTQIGTTNLTLPATLYAGLPVTAHNNAALNTATLDNVSLILPCTNPSTPTGLSAGTGLSQISLTWGAVSGATSYIVKRATTTGGPYSNIATNATTSFTNTGLTACTTYYYVVSAVNACGESANSSQVSATPYGNLPGGWSKTDIGSVGIAGNSGSCGSTFMVQGSGTDIWDTADAFQFPYQTLTGDGAIIARVVTVGNTDPWAKAGVMMRDTLTAGSAHAMMILSSSQGSSFQWRSTANGSMSFIQQTNVAAPYWVKLVRAGNTFTGFSSSNGSSWTQIGSTNITLAATVYVGLPVTAHNNSALNTATFDNVSIVNVPSAPSNLTAAAISTTGIDLAWTDTSSNESGFAIERASSASGPWSQIASAAANATSYSNSGLSPNTKFYYRVAATNSAGLSAYTSVASATTFANTNTVAAKKTASAITVDGNLNDPSGTSRTS